MSQGAFLLANMDWISTETGSTLSVVFYGLQPSDQSTNQTNKQTTQPTNQPNKQPMN